MDSITTERYIELLCKFNTQLVYPFLTSVESYRHEKALEVKKYIKIIIKFMQSIQDYYADVDHFLF